MISKPELYQKAYERYMQRVRLLCIKIQREGHSSETHDTWSCLDKQLTNYHTKCFAKKAPNEVAFSLTDFKAEKYNKKFIVSKDSQFLNIWRKVGSGFFSLPIQIHKSNLESPTSNYYLIDLESLELGIFYSMEGNTAWEFFIEEQFKDSKEVYNELQESSNRLIKGLG